MRKPVDSLPRFPERSQERRPPPPNDWNRLILFTAVLVVGGGTLYALSFLDVLLAVGLMAPFGIGFAVICLGIIFIVLLAVQQRSN